MSRRPLIAGNWKMNLDLAQSKALAAAVAASASRAAGRDVVIAPATTALATVAEVIRDSRVILAAQNVCWAESGAFTGEVSPAMLKELGCGMVILGHSERRQIFGETDELVGRRLRGTLAQGLTPILCIGETGSEREAGQTFAVLERQTRAALAGTSAGGCEIVIAYEPVWAIGTGKTASEAQAQEAHAFIRGVLGGLFEKKIAQAMRILYGGSVHAGNVDSLMAQEDIDGVLVGGASLKADSFDRIVKYL